MNSGGNGRYAAFMAIAVILLLVFFEYNYSPVALHRGKVPDGAEEPFPGFPVDINRADVPALMLIPGVGTRTAEAIIAEREKKGSFSSIKDIRKVRGIGQEKFKAMRGYIIIKKTGKKSVSGE